jgi:hypothetical protein
MQKRLIALPGAMVDPSAPPRQQVRSVLAFGSSIWATSRRSPAFSPASERMSRLKRSVPPRWSWSRPP